MRVIHVEKCTDCPYHRVHEKAYSITEGIVKVHFCNKSSKEFFELSERFPQWCSLKRLENGWDNK